MRMIVGQNVVVPLAVSLPVAIVLMLVLVWHWRSMRGKETPRSRRRIRRANTMVQFVLVAALFHALSLVDPDVQPARYAVAWVGVVLLVLITITLAFVDSLNNMRILKRDRQDARRETVAELKEILPLGEKVATDPTSEKDAENKAPPDDPGKNGPAHRA